MKRKDGKKVLVQETSRALRDRSGKMILYRGILRDVTHLKQLEEQLRQAQKMEEIGRLAGGVAHDFNNILMAIGSYSEILRLKTSPSDELHSDIQEIQKAAEAGARLTRQLLAFSRQQVLEPRIINLTGVVTNLEAMLQRLLPDDIRLKLHMEPDLQRIKADPGQIEQVILNLAVNARDAMPGGGTLTIETANVTLESDFRQQPPGDYVMLSVGDTGEGMDEATLSRIFEPFFSTKEAGKGTGLGLATVYGIVKQSGGYIWVFSERGRGSVFRIHFPRIDVVDQVESGRFLRAAEVETGGQETILVVDDNQSVRAGLAALLEMHGYRVLQATNGIEALQLAQRYEAHIHLLITDVIMPQMNGRRLARLLAVKFPQIKTILISGFDQQAVSEEGTYPANTIFLPKPVAREVLLAKIRELLG